MNVIVLSFDGISGEHLVAKKAVCHSEICLEKNMAMYVLYVL